MIWALGILVLTQLTAIGKVPLNLKYDSSRQLFIKQSDSRSYSIGLVSTRLAMLRIITRGRSALRSIQAKRLPSRVTAG